MADPVLIRQVAPGDLNLIFAWWLRELRDADAGSLPDDLFFPAHRALIERVLADSSVVTLVAAAADEPSEILGFVVAQPESVLHWIHVRKGLRGHGLAKRLLLQAGASPAVPAAWRTVSSRTRLKNPFRGREIRARLRRPAAP